MRNSTIRQKIQRLIGKAVVFVVILPLPACMCPGHLGKRTTTLANLSENPGISLNYMGSDDTYHYFFRRNCYSLFALGEWSVTDTFRVRQSEYAAVSEVVLTKDRSRWKNYTGDARKQLHEDFVSIK
jgi:hypothetical protein